MSLSHDDKKEIGEMLAAALTANQAATNNAIAAAVAASMQTFMSLNPRFAQMAAPPFQPPDDEEKAELMNFCRREFLRDCINHEWRGDNAEFLHCNGNRGSASEPVPHQLRVVPTDVIRRAYKQWLEKVDADQRRERENAQALREMARPREPASRQQQPAGASGQR
jgi:hypothetical protein